MDFDFAEFENTAPDGGAESVDQFVDDIGIFGLDPKEAEELRQLKDAVLFVIDCRPSMVSPNAHNKGGLSSTATALAAAQSFMKSKIISNSNDRVGVVLYNTERTENQLEFQSIHLLQKLDLIDAARILDLHTAHQNIRPAKKEVALFQVLWIANTELKVLEKLAFAKRIFLFTDESNPNSKSHGDQQRAFQRAQDLAELGVTIQLFPMPKPADKDPRFDIRLFYTNIVFVDPDDHAALAEFALTQDRISELMDRIRHKQFQKRIGGRCLFALQPDMAVGVQFYQMVRPASLPSATQMDGKTNKPLKTTTAYICEETGAQLYPNQIGHCVEYGGEKVLINKDDMRKIKNFDTPGLKLMGFKPRSKLKNYHNIRPSYFLYPDEKRVQGSAQLFDALIKTMVKQQTMAIARFQPRQISMVRFCALVAQSEQVDEEDGFQTPPGLQLIFLPYANDIRDVENNLLGEVAAPDAEQVEVAKEIVEQLTIDFNPRQFENPSVQNFYTTLQSLALKEDRPEEVEDLLNPDQKRMAMIEDAFEHLLGDFSGIMDQDEVPKAGAKPRAKKAPAKKKGAAAPKKAAAKRGAAKNSQADDDYDLGEAEFAPKKRGPARKARKKSESEEEVGLGGNGYDMADDDQDLREQMASGELDQMTAAELKDIAKERSLDIKGKKKAEVLSTIKRYLKKK